jgi:hypothetical protein
MLDPGRYLAEAIYFLQYTLAQILWAVDRALLSIAIIAESVNSWVTENVGYFVELLVNALSAPLGGMFILALTALGFWYALNNVVPTGRWVDPGKLFTYGLIAFFFFSSPIVVIDQMEDLRQSLNAGIDQALIDGAAGDIFDTSMNGTDAGLPGAIPDVNSDGVVGSFDLVAAFMAVSNLDELDSSEFPVDFEAAYFPFGDPSSINLSDEADQELAKALASDGIERLFFSLVAIPTAIAEHFLRLALTGVALFLYLGVPMAMLFAFFIYTQAFLGAYLRQFINLLVETLLSVIIAAIMIGLLAAAARQGTGLFIAASIITLIVLLWRVKSALRLASAAFDLFGGAMLTGGAGGLDVTNMGRQAVAGTVSAAGAALTGGATAVLGGAVLASAAALQADGRANGAYLRADPVKTGGRVRQLKTIAGYTLGRSETIRHAVEGAHEVRTLGRNFRDGQVEPHEPDILDYLRAGSSMSGFGSSPWLAMRLSPSLRAAYDQIGGRSYSYGLLGAAFDEGEAPVSTHGAPGQPGRELVDRLASLEQTLTTLNETLIGPETTGRRPGIATLEGAPTAPAHVREQNDVQDIAAARVTPGPTTGSGQALDREGREDKRENSEGGGGPASLAGSVRLEGADEARRQAIHTVLEQLQAPESLSGQAAYQTLVTFSGVGNAGLLQTAVSQHTAAAVQAAAGATGDLEAQYRAGQLDDARILAAFQSGEATSTLRSTLSAQGEATPLTDEQLAAVADMVLLPQRRLTRGELAAVIGLEVAAGATTEQAVADALGMGAPAAPSDFGGMTGAIRGVMAGARDMNLSPEDLTRLAELISGGLREAVQAELIGRGYRPEVVHGLVSDLASLPGAITVPQTTSRRPQPSDDV